MGVEAGRDQDDVGGEGGDRRLDARAIGGEISVGARAARQGNVDGGADAAVALAREIWWWRPLVWFAKLPGAMPLLHAGYHSIALNRSCAAESCVTPRDARRM